VPVTIWRALQTTSESSLDQHWINELCPVLPFIGSPALGTGVCQLPPTRRLANFRVAPDSARARGSRHETRRYDPGMTRSKIAISLPRDQIARVHREVRSGRAGSVSGYIASVLAEQERRESLRELLRDLIEQHGEPSAKDIKWAERALEQRRG
jgi:hypothetical protein